jgi:transcriptional regulator with XRE-family HTH domain
MSDAAAVAPSWKGREPVANRFGKRLRELRTGRGYTQEKISEITGLARSFISEMENGKQEPTTTTLDLLSIAFNLTLSELLEGV